MYSKGTAAGAPERSCTGSRGFSTAVNCSTAEVLLYNIRAPAGSSRTLYRPIIIMRGVDCAY